MLRTLDEVGGLDFERTGIPLKFSESPADPQEPPPDLGGHTEKVLQNILGLFGDEIERLRNVDAIGSDLD